MIITPLDNYTVGQLHGWTIKKMYWLKKMICIHSILYDGMVRDGKLIKWSSPHPVYCIIVVHQSGDKIHVRYSLPDVVEYIRYEYVDKHNQCVRKIHIYDDRLTVEIKHRDYTLNHVDGVIELINNSHRGQFIINYSTEFMNKTVDQLYLSNMCYV